MSNGMDDNVPVDLLRMIFRQAPAFAAVFVGDDHHCLLTNSAFEGLVGRRELIGRPLADALPELAEQGALPLMDGVRSSGEAHSGTAALLTFVPPELGVAVPHFVDYVLQPLKQADGSVTAILMLGADVTDRVIAEQELQSREATVRRTLDALPLGIVTFDRFSIVRMVNEHYARGRDRTVDDLVGIHLRELVGDSSYAIRAPVVEAVLQGETREFVEIRMAEDGKLHRYFQKYFPRLHEGEIIGFYGTTMDITAHLAPPPDETANRH